MLKKAYQIEIEMTSQYKHEENMITRLIICENSNF